MTPCFPGIQRSSYNFLLGCHHRFQVAVRTPELWNSWGNNLKDRKRGYLRSAAIGLILDGCNNEEGFFDEALRDGLRDRAVRGVVRKVHLRGSDTQLLATIISSFILEGEGVRHSRIVLSNVDVSDLFVRHHFPELRDLCLSGCFKIFWNYLKFTTTTLTNLSLNFISIAVSSAIPTAFKYFHSLSRILTFGPLRSAHW